MRFLPTPWRRRRPVPSRPRVARAAAAAHLAFATASPLGSSLAGPAVFVLASPPAWPTPSAASLAPSIVLATTRAAQAMGREPAGVQADLVRAWAASCVPLPRSPVVEAKRQASWQAIDATLATLRAS